MFEQYRPVQHWATRYFRSLDQEEVLVTVHPESGRILGYNHTLPEDRPGAGPHRRCRASDRQQPSPSPAASNLPPWN